MPHLGARGGFWTAGAVVALALWTSACPTMTYPLYQSGWHISTTTVTWIFAAYPIALIPVLVIFGDLSDHIGRRAAMLLGLGAELVGVLLFAVATDVGWLLAGRAFMGLGVGLSLGAANVAMVEFSGPGQEKRAGAIGTAVSALGIALAMLVGGALTEYAPYPLRLNFVVLAAIIAVVGLLVLCMPRHTRDETDEPWRVRAIVIPRGNRGIFTAGSIAMASSFLLGSIVLPLGAKIAQQLAGSTNALVTGLLLSVFAGCITLNALVARKLDVWVLVIVGAAGSVAAVWLFVLTGATHSLTVFFLASACAGAAYAFDFAGGLTVLNRYAAPHHRASMVSGGYLVGYLCQGIGAPALGVIVTGHGLTAGLLAGATAFSVFFCAVLLSAFGTVAALRRAASTTP
ncbi:Predicted arabinose efflux permease, MFS family [Nonomuraea maritima]|uniref:Predicted arabinose efflux permease, MFS family n=1 Tax=Nonomuraea maritima TaxID=683260 RepID=A0A1G8YZ03_9ACTN|nr:MFS transporter [Nonomuraea maritima]SDK08119.1 Predicted arabinose efflux permease, MFS family [Nonomuraea maritima]